MAKINYVRLSKQVEDEELLERVMSLRELRLLSLKTDPTSFISRYEDEVDQPTEFWVDRHREPNAEHFVAQVENDPNDKTVADGTPKFVAFLVLVRRGCQKPEASDSTPPVSGEQKVATYKLPVYSMEALYVEPQSRRKGVCGRLIQAMMYWIGEDTRKAKMDKAKILTTVAEENVSAKDIYLKQGFILMSRTTIQDKAGHDRVVMALEYTMNCGESEPW